MLKKEQQEQILQYCKSNKIRLIYLEYYLTFPSICYSYVYHVIKGRFELFEQVISKDAYYSYYYARDVLKGRFELGEPAISKNAGYSSFYSFYLLRNRFELGEKAIKNSSYWDEYKKYFVIED